MWLNQKGPLCNAFPVCGHLKPLQPPPWPPIQTVTCKFDSREPQLWRLRKLLRREKQEGERSAVLAKRLANCHERCLCQGRVVGQLREGCQIPPSVRAPRPRPQTAWWPCSPPPKLMKLHKQIALHLKRNVSYDGGDKRWFEN